MDPNLYQVIMDSMSAHVAILDEEGTIIETNRSWQDFARQNGMPEPCDSIGVNYLMVSEPAGIFSDHEKTTVLIATHDLTVDLYADDVYHLQDGRVVS